MQRWLSLRFVSLARIGAVMLAAAAVLVAGLYLLGNSHALDFHHVPGDKDGDHLVDISDPQPNVYCGFAHADVGNSGFGELDGNVDLPNDVLGAALAYGTTSPLHDQNHNDIVDLLDIQLVVAHYTGGAGYDCSGATPDPTPVQGLGSTSGPGIVHNGPALLTGNEGSITVTVSTAGVATDPYHAFNIGLRFNTAVVQGTGFAYSGIVGGDISTCFLSFVNSGEGKATGGCGLFVFPAATTNVGPLMGVTFDVIAAGDPEFRLVCFGAPDNGGAFDGTYTVGADVAPQIQAVQGCATSTPTPTDTPTPAVTPTDTPTPTPTAPPVESVSTPIGAGGGSLTTDTGGTPDPVEAELVVPEGALTGDVVITIDVFNIEELPAPTGDGLFMSRGFSFEPDGLVFDPDFPATAIISYDESEFTGSDESTIGVLAYNHQTDAWEIAEVIDRDTVAHTITISMPHFSHRGICHSGADCDRDGAINLRELETINDGGQGTSCGLRDPVNAYDFYDTGNGGDKLGVMAEPFVADGVIDLPNDILGTILNYTGNPGYAPTHTGVGSFPVDAAANTGFYRVAFDRDEATGPNHWNRHGTDGVIDLPNDILGVILQYTGNDGCGDGA